MHHVFHLQQACIHILVVRETASNVMPTFSLSKAIYCLIHAHKHRATMQELTICKYIRIRLIILS